MNGELSNVMPFVAACNGETPGTYKLLRAEFCI